MATKKVRRLYESFHPENYTLSLQLDSDNLTVSGTVVITGLKVGRPSQRLSFHQHGLTVTEASVTKRDKKGEQVISVDRINNHNAYDEVRLHTLEKVFPGEYEVRLQFKGRIQESMHGIYISNFEVDSKKHRLISTQFESHHAREAFPCIDEPEAKATFDLTLLTKDGETVISNTPAKSPKTVKPKAASTEFVETVFETTPRMSTYLLAFVVGAMQYKEAKTKNGVAVRVWSTKAQPLDSLDFALDVAKRAIEFFEEYYGVPYPLAKSDHVAIPDFSSGAMENWGLITYRERVLLVDPQTASQSGRETVAMVISHELSHQWFGNLVTMRWWDDLWLNESFANVMEYVAVDALFPKWHVWDAFITQEGLSAFRRDSVAGVQAVKIDVNHPDEISTLFDPSIVYAKGGRLLYMLMQYLGPEAFRKGLNAYFKKHAYGNTTGDDLWAALGAASGKDVGSFMNPWLTRSGFPVVAVAKHGTDTSLTQSHFLLDPAKADPKRLWPVPLLANKTEVPELMSGRSASVNVSGKDPLRINIGGVGHYIVHYLDAAHAEAIAKLIDKQELGVPERFMLLSDSSLLSRGGVGSFDATLRLLEHYTHETSEPVWDSMSLIIGDARRFEDVDPDLEKPIKALVRSLIQAEYERLGWQEKSGESSQDTKLRATIIGLGVYSEHPEILAKALELFEQYKTNPKAVDDELRSIVFGAAIRTKTAGAFQYLLKLDESTHNVDLKQEVLGALTLTRDTGQIDSLLGRLKDPAKVRQQDFDNWLVLLLRSRYARKQAWDWMRANWPWIEKTFSGDKSYDYFPRYAAGAFSTQELLDEYKAFFGPMLHIPALKRNIEIGIEELTNRVEWLMRDLPAVRTYLKAVK